MTWWRGRKEKRAGEIKMLKNSIRHEILWQIKMIAYVKMSDGEDGTNRGTMQVLAFAAGTMMIYRHVSSSPGLSDRIVLVHGRIVAAVVTP
jgi:hypothetical protein